MKLFRLTIWMQATYVFVTAVWPLVDINSFIYVTGYKRDIWLVKTVGALLIPVAACLYTYLVLDSDRRPAIVLGGLTAVAFVSIDLYYSLTDVISDIYLVDAAVEFIFVILWLIIAFHDKPNPATR